MNKFSKYVKYLERNKFIESEVSIRTLKSNIKILDNFNFVRYNQSLSHDNMIFNSTIALKLFINYIENRIN